MAKRLVPNYGQVILKPIEEGEKVYGNIVVPDLENSKLLQGIIIDIKPIYNFNLGTEVPCIFKKGDIVLIPPMGSQKQKIDGEDFIICGITDLPAAIIEEEEQIYDKRINRKRIKRRISGGD